MQGRKKQVKEDIKNLFSEVTEGISSQKIEKRVEQILEQFVKSYEKPIGELIKSEMIMEYIFNYMNQVENIVKDLDPEWFKEIEMPLKRVESIIKRQQQGGEE